ncbi:MAG: 4-hydroxy-3-methylbut-2-enyl diphosphate reductase [Thermotogae bacterium]|nr:4-hydroxy-3-methylbut-2-enyl diphosphate reductase [Thermotogota bacterium]
MNMILAKNIGFCSGVKRIIHLVETMSKGKKKVYYWGALIHNSVELSRLNDIGIKEFDGNVKSGENAIVVTRAHGTSKEEVEMLRKKVKVLDGTCPKVIKIHQMVDKAIKEGYRVIVYGNERHAEMKALRKDYENEVKIISDVNSIEGLTMSDDEKLLLISQTTMMKEDFEKIAFALKNKFKNLKVYNTICEETLARQKEAIDIAKSVDVVLVIGGKNSSNTDTLVKIAKEYNTRVFHVEDEKALFPGMFINANTVGVLSGTSTPIYLVKRIIEKCKS